MSDVYFREDGSEEWVPIGILLSELKHADDELMKRVRNPQDLNEALFAVQYEEARRRASMWIAGWITKTFTPSN